MNSIPKTTLLALILGIFLFAGCAEKKKYYKVRSHKPTRSTLGFSVVPPPGNNWFVQVKDNSLIYLKKSDPYAYSLQTKATEIKFSKSTQLKDDFIQYVLNKKAKSLVGIKYKNAKIDYTFDNEFAAFCVKYNHRYEDHGYRHLKEDQYVIIVNKGVVCKHPKYPKNGIELSYKEKILSSSHHPSFRNEGEQFLKGLAFLSRLN